MKPIKSYNFLLESKLPDGYVLGYLKDNAKLDKINKVNKDRSVFVNALQYTKGGPSDKIDVILKDDIKINIIKSDLVIKF